MIQQQFAEQAREILATDESVAGLAVAGSWLTNELDEFSDLDLVIVTKEKVAPDQRKMLGYAERLGHLLSGFTGDHVGEPRLLICLYDDPLLHVDLKFVTPEEFGRRIETPILLLDKYGQLEEALQNATSKFPYPDNQWIEDRFWTWVHYALVKIGRGEYLEAYDFLGFLRMTVFGPLLHIKNGNLPRGVRKVETALQPADLQQLVKTIPAYNAPSLLRSLRQAAELYRALRDCLYGGEVQIQKQAEIKVMSYFDTIERISITMDNTYKEVSTQIGST
ncbi:MAG TPA: nucleotidyltransferase domain-containing protein [Flavisolibacter sp.]